MICYTCGFWDSDYESCTCPAPDKQYACPIESKESDDDFDLLYPNSSKEEIEEELTDLID